MIEILTTHWSTHTQSNYVTYPNVLPALMKMLHAGEKVESQVFAMHLGMLKNLVVSSIDSDADRLRLIQGSKIEEDSN